MLSTLVGFGGGACYLPKSCTTLIKSLNIVAWVWGAVNPNTVIIQAYELFVPNLDSTIEQHVQRFHTTWERALEVGFQSTHAQAIARLIDTFSYEGQRVATAILRALEGILDLGTVDFEDFCRVLIDSWEEFAAEANVPLVGEAEVGPELGDEPNFEFKFENPESEDEPENEDEPEQENEPEPEVGQEVEAEARGEIGHEAELESEPESTITSNDEAPPAKVPRVHGGWISEDDD
ncbi:hypothetical protein Adt_45239 [Abeliophyllum distichum]|uniref:Pre-rRNA-processing protein TSR2 n=1 Tax=Abeliophyllum distichum TaxID=126358 RepID=A0ABD1PDX0_9LAMI